MSGYNDYLREHRRITILRALMEVPGYALNSSIMRQILDDYRLAASRDQIHTEFAWLSEQGLVTVEEVGSVHTATITERGADVASGSVTVPGVKRPGPGG